MQSSMEKEKPTLNDQYQRLIEARNFHYDNFNKWLRFFYVLIGAIFAAFCTLYTSGDVSIQIKLVVAIIGYIVSLACLLSAKGYYYWEYKWIMQIHRFEKEVLKYDHDDMQVYSAFYDKTKHNKPASLKDGANVSTTKVALAVTEFIIVVWGMMIVYLAAQWVTCNWGIAFYPCCLFFVALFVSIVVSYVLMVAGCMAFPSELEGIDEIKK